MILTGKKIVLRDLIEADLPIYQGWLSNKHEWKKYDGPYYPLDESKVLENIGRLRKRVESSNWPEPRRSLVIADLATNGFVGLVSWYWESKETNWLSVGIVIYDPAFWSGGIGYEALGLWSDYLLIAMPDLVRLGLATWSGNVRMMRLAEKLGYQEEARRRKARIVDGEYYDSMGYGVLREEWEARYPQGFGSTL